MKDDRSKRLQLWQLCDRPESQTLSEGNAARFQFMPRLFVHKTSPKHLSVWTFSDDITTTNYRKVFQIFKNKTRKYI